MIKALLPIESPWKAYVGERLKGINVVRGGPTHSANVFAAKPHLAELEGSILWKAIWRNWLEIRGTMAWRLPQDKENAAGCRVQGNLHLWLENRHKKIDKSQRLHNAGMIGIVTLGDVWSWENSSWYTREELRTKGGLPSSAAKLVHEITTESLDEEIKLAMQREFELKKGVWIPRASIFDQNVRWQQKRLMFVEEVRVVAGSPH